MELLPNEIILWKGKPDLKKILTKSDAFLLPFSILWGGFAITWCTLAAIYTDYFGLFGLPFAVIGMYLIFGRFIVKQSNKKKTYFAITDSRILVIKTNSKGVRKNIGSAQMKSIPNESVSFDKNGFGTITFGQTPYGYMINKNTGLDFFDGLYQNGVLCFYDIENCENVFQIYKKAKYQQSQNHDL